MSFRAELRQGAPLPARNPVVTPQGRGRLRIMAISANIEIFWELHDWRTNHMRRTTFSQGIGALPFLALLFRAMCMVGRLVARHASRSSSRRALVCCQHLPPTHTSRISHALEAQLTAAVPLVLHSTDEAEAVCGVNIMRNLTSEHVKPKVCSPEAPSNCRSSRSALLPCALLTSTFGD